MATGGAIVGITVASPEIGINVTSALRGVPDIGLGRCLARTRRHLMMVTVAYLATCKEKRGDEHQGHEEHRREHLLKVGPKP